MIKLEESLTLPVLEAITAAINLSGSTRILMESGSHASFRSRKVRVQGSRWSDEVSVTGVSKSVFTVFVKMGEGRWIVEEKGQK